MSTHNTKERTNNLLFSTTNDWNKNGQLSGQATLTSEVNSARDKANFDQWTQNARRPCSMETLRGCRANTEQARSRNLQDAIERRLDADEIRTEPGSVPSRIWPRVRKNQEFMVRGEDSIYDAGWCWVIQYKIVLYCIALHWIGKVLW